METNARNASIEDVYSLLKELPTKGDKKRVHKQVKKKNRAR
jgi:hypothetical protein